MPENGQVIERALSGPFSTSGSFEDERLRSLWERCRLLFATGLAISLIALIVGLFVPSMESGFESELRHFGWLTNRAAHAASFAIALALLYSVCSKSYRFLHTVAFGTVAFNLVLAIYNSVAFHPAADPSFGVSLLLFLAAAFIPWRPSHQWALAALAAIWFLFLQGIVYSTLPEYQAYWAELGGAEAARNRTIWGVVAIAILGGAEGSRFLADLLATNPDATLKSCRYRD